MATILGEVKEFDGRKEVTTVRGTLNYLVTAKLHNDRGQKVHGVMCPN